jgi:hypothetical protein
VWGFANFDVQCRPTINIPINVLKKPKYGTITFRDEESTISTVSNPTRSHCVGTRQRTRTAYYVVSDKERQAANDTIVIRVVYGSATYDNEFEVDLAHGKATRTKVTRQ